MARYSIPALESEKGLARYFQEVWSYPILSADEEQDLARRWRHDGDVEAAHKLVTSHLRLVAKIASGYRGYGLPLADLIAEGNIGLMKAVKKFEPEKGFRLSTYAMWWIRASITEFVLRSWSMVRMGTLAAQKKLFFSLSRIKRKLNVISDGPLNDEQAETVARAMNVSAADVADMDRRLSLPDMSLNAPRQHDDGEGADLITSLVDDSPDPEAVTAATEEQGIRNAMLKKALETLPEREKHILSERHLRDDPPTLEELGQDYGLSRERIRQLEARALDRVRKSMIAMAAETGIQTGAGA